MQGKKPNSGEEPSDESDAPPARLVGASTRIQKRYRSAHQTQAKKRKIWVGNDKKRFLASYWER